MARTIRCAFAAPATRFIIIGGINVALAYLAFALVTIISGSIIAALFAQHLLSVSVTFVGYRRFVYGVRGGLLVDFLRFESVTGTGFIANLIIVPLLVGAAHLAALFAQAIFVGVYASGSFLVHRHFSFRRRLPRPAPRSPATCIAATTAA